MTLDEAFQGSICTFQTVYSKETSFVFGPDNGFISLTEALYAHRSNSKSLTILKIVPTEKAKKWLNDNYLQEYPLP